MKKISIIIPAYNAGKYIIRCLGSIKTQTYKNCEIIIINDRSTDDTLNLLDGYKKNNLNEELVIINTTEKSGPSKARNLGVKKATGDYVFFIDADDDLVDESVLQDFINRTSDNPDVVLGETLFFVDNVITHSNYHKLKNKKLQYIGNEIYDGFLSGEWASTVWNKLYDINFIRKNNLEFPEGLLHEDELWVFQFSALAAKINFLNRKTYNYYYSNQGSITANVGHKNLGDYREILKLKLKFALKYDLYTKNNKTESYIRNFAKQILLPKAVLLDYSFFRTFYSELRNDFKSYFLKKNEFELPARIAYYLYKMKYDNRFFLYGKLPKYVNRLIKI